MTATVGPRHRRQGRDRLVVEELGDRHRQPASRARAMTWMAMIESPPRLEEVVLGADPLQAQHLAERGGEDALGLAARLNERGAGVGRSRAGGGQGGPVDLAAGGHRQGGQLGERGRDHELRQPAAQELAQVARRREAGGGVGRDEVGGQACRRRCPLTAVTTAARTPGWAARAACTSPGSIR